MALERALIRPTADVRKFDPTADTLEVSDIDYAGAITIGTASATGIDIGLVGILTTIKGDLQVDGTSTLVDTITAQGDVNLGDGGDTINIGFDATDTINLNTNLTVAASVLIDLATNGGYINLPTQVQAVAIDGSDGYLRLNVAGAADILEFLDIGVGWVTLAILGGITLDEAYNASGGPSTITVDAGDVTWNEVGAYSFVVGLSGCTGAADGFFVEDGTDYFRLTHAAANALTCAGQFSSLQLDSAADISLDAATSSNFTITANDALAYTLTISAVNTGVGGTARIGIGADDDIDISSTAGRLTLNGFSSAGIGIEIEAVAGGGSVDIGAVNLPNQLNLGTGGVRPVILGSITGAAATTLRSGTGAFTVTAGGILDVNVQSDITIDSTAAGISLDAVASSNFSITDNSVNDRTLTLSATNAGAGKAYVDIYSDDSTYLRSTAGTVLIDAVSNLELNSSGGVINIGNDAVAQNINIGTAGARAIAIGSATATAITLDAVGGISLDAEDTSDFVVQANSVANKYLMMSVSNSGGGDSTLYLLADDVGGGGACNMVVRAGTNITIDAGGVLELNSSAGVIGIGNDAVNQAINLGTAGVRTISVGSAAATAVNIDAIAISLDASSTSNFSITDNSVNDRTLTLSATNAGAGKAYVDIYSEDQTTVRATAGSVLIDATGVVELNSSADVISIGNDAVNQNINIGTAGARTIALGSATATAVTLDAIALSLDATDNSNFTVMTNSAAAKDLYIHLENIGAGVGSVTIVAGDRFCVSDQTLTLAAYGPVSSLVDIVSDGDIHTSSTGDTAIAANADITFTGNLAAPTAFNDVTDTVLVGFASASIVGALNELKEGYLAYGVYNVVANTYAFNDFTVSVILVDYTATGTCTVTIDSDQIAVSGRCFVIKDSGQNAAANNITVATEGAETIEGEADYVINTDGGWLTLVSDGSNLHLI